MSTPPKPIWTAAEAAAATGGKTTGGWNLTGLALDSREVSPGDLFLALPGEQTDGHRFVAAALDKGAAAALVSQIPTGMEHDPRLLQVKDVRAALVDLAGTARHRSAAKIIGVTGSVGKTSTKDMLALALTDQTEVFASPKNRNNDLGVPFSLAQLPATADIGIFEMGMNHANEIRPLSQMVKPHIALITAVTPAHIENFETGLEGIADAKAEIFEGLKPGGTAILPRDSEMFPRLLAAARTAGAQKIRTFGEHPDADARLSDVIEARNGTRATVTLDGTAHTLFIPAGKHQACNALAVLLAVQAAGRSVERAIKALADFHPGEGRGQEEYLDIGDPKNPVVLIDDSYNASPASMQAAFRVLALIDPGRGGRRIAVLGDMRELGQQGPRLHADLAVPLHAAGIDLVYTAGPLMKNLHEALPANQRGAHRETSSELAQIVPDVLVPGDVVLVKGSHGSRMDVVVEALRALPGRKGHPANKKTETDRHAL